ncbi:hypothetical protein SFC43_25625 [Bacteroides sp. CR5/BHMF/2]|nr:hypothetical protein [Bacteroides sp. CR5/BHMF/2]
MGNLRSFKGNIDISSIWTSGSNGLESTEEVVKDKKRLLPPTKKAESVVLINACLLASPTNNHFDYYSCEISLIEDLELIFLSM